jgi:His/Glu/Gln/Arg/opine family amino acid ABC transporter permease subunit
VRFDFSVIVETWPLFLHGLAITLLCSVFALALGLILGGVIALGRLSRRPWLRWPASVYVEIVRDTPFLVQAFLIYFLLPRYRIRLPATTAGIIALALYGAAGFAESIRGAVLSVARGQVEAARAVGMSHLLTMRRIVSPQMMSYLVPSLTNQFIGLVKESSVLSIITVPELTMASSLVLGRTFAAVEAYSVVALLYWALTLAIAVGMGVLERRTAGPVRTARPWAPLLIEGRES